MKSKFQASIIIPTYNKAERLKLTLITLEKLHYLENIQIIIVNDGSVDETGSILESYKKRENFKIFNSVNKGRSNARNIGIEEADGEIIIFTDDDLLLEQDFAISHIHAHKENENVLYHGCIYNLPYVKFFKDPATGTMVDGSKAKKSLLPYIVTPEKIKNDLSSITKQKKLGKFENDIHKILNCTEENIKKYKWIACTGGNFSVSKKLLRLVGGFDNALGKEWGCEDLELGYRLSQIGVEIRLCESAVNYHLCHYRDNSEDIHKRAVNYFYMKYMDDRILDLNKYFNGELQDLVCWSRGISENTLVKKGEAG